MPSSRRALLRPLLLLIIAGSTGAFSSRSSECSFPSRWEGTWFQSGVRQAILISKNILSSKGKCLHNEGDKFLLVDEKSCYRCVVIHEKHSNVLQYKETYCHGRNSLSSLCSYITGDALLYSMFREEATSVPCPFHGPMTFTYNRGHGKCSSPLSNVDTCTDDSRLLFRYQACPDVPASESAVEELECLAMWKEGSSRYLVGRLHNGHSSSNEDRYRCFVYERAGQNVANLNRAAGVGAGAIDHEVGLMGGPVSDDAPEVYTVAQSGDATCNGLFSPLEGSRTMTLTKVSSPGKCRFPPWLTGHTSNGLTWHTLDLAKSYTFYSRNASLHTIRTNTSVTKAEAGPLDFLNIPGQDDHNVNILCNSIKQSDPAETMTMLVAHFTVGCQSGYVCMTFYRRDGHVVEVQTGSTASRAEEACSAPHYLQHSIPYITLVTSSPEPRQCPYLGKFTVTGSNRNQRNSRDGRKNQNMKNKPEKVRHGQERSDDRRSRRLEFDIEKRRGNQYLIHERNSRKTRSESWYRNLRWPNLEEDRDIDSRLAQTNSEDRSPKKSTPRSRRHPKMEDFQVDMDDFAQIRRVWAPEFDESGSSMEEVHQDYFGEYMDSAEPPKKRAPKPVAGDSRFLSYQDLLRMKRDLEDEYQDYPERREKREEEERRCNSDITTLIVGCSTADRMEFQSDCVDDDAVTAYSCHGRWFDAEGTQFVIATPLARSTAWSNENNRPQPYRNTRRLCFMYRESGGVVSLTASPVACQRGIPPPPPMLAFNATSIGQCMEDSGPSIHGSSCIIMTALALIVAVFR